MADPIRNPRRVPRVPARCEARCLLPGGAFWASDTRDFGPHGCQLAAPGPFKKGDPVKLVLTSERMAQALPTVGTVAWASRNAPWRIGVAFDESFLGTTARWFDDLLKAYPGLAAFQHAPDSLEPSAFLRLGPAPPVAPDLDAEELVVMRAVGGGITVSGLQEKLAPEWPSFEGVLFSMIGKRLLTLDPASAAPPGAWATYLAAQP
jgi:hypothetical protein